MTSIPDAVQYDPRLRALSTIACSVSPGAGGLGRHFDELIGLAESLPLPSFRYICPSPRTTGDARHVPVAPRIRGGRFLGEIPITYAYGSFIYVAGISFDFAVRAKIDPVSPGYTAFASQALISLRHARRVGVPILGLVAPNSHVDNVWRQQDLARSRYPIDRGWLTAPLRRRTLAEYNLADIIIISSEYQRRTFLESGVNADKLVRIDLRPHPRFSRRTSSPNTDTYNVSYIGRFDLIKGLPVLLDAFLAAGRPDWRLTLMGQYCSHGVRRYVESRIADDPRIVVRDYGDPDVILRASNVFVHPTFEDGYGYAPMEALAVGVPVIVTNETGMAEYVDEGTNGSVVPAGDVDALAERLVYYYNQR